MDEDLRRMHREARVGLGRHSALIGRWVRISGARESWRGILDSVQEVGGGIAVLHLTDCRALEALSDKNNEVLIGHFEVYSHAVLGIGPQPTAWAN